MSRGSRHYSVDDYFAVEEMSDVRHEFYDGEILAMAGASLEHNEITANILTELRGQLRSSDCGAYGSDLRIVAPRGLYTYPDVSVFCGPVVLAPGRSDTATNPRVIVEVLSEATEEYDRGDKFELYKSIPDLRHYIVVSQAGILVDHFQRSPEEIWPCRSMRNRTDIIELADLDVRIALGEVYRRVFA